MIIVCNRRLADVSQHLLLHTLLDGNFIVVIAQDLFIRGRNQDPRIAIDNNVTFGVQRQGRKINIRQGRDTKRTCEDRRV